MLEEIKNKESKKPKLEKVDRIPLSQKSTEIVEATIEQMLKKHPGVKMNKKDFINWLIEDSFEKLTPQDEKRLFDRFYDEIKFIERSLRDLKKKRQSGEVVSLEKILKQAKPKFKPDAVKKETVKVIDTEKVKPIKDDLPPAAAIK